MLFVVQVVLVLTLQATLKNIYYLVFFQLVQNDLTSGVFKPIHELPHPFYKHILPPTYKPTNRCAQP